MTLDPFTEKANPPTKEGVAAALGRSATHWRALLAHLAETYPRVTETWRFFGGKLGHWTLRVMSRKRTIFWLKPGRKSFLASTAFGEKAVAAARESDLPAEVIEAIDGARKYAEGRPVRIEVRTKADLEVTKLVAAIKMAN